MDVRWVVFLGLFLSGCVGGSSKPGLLVYDTDFLVDGCDGESDPDNETLVQSAEGLSGEGIDVLSSHCARVVDAAWPAVCPGPTGRIHVHRIHAQSLIDAEPHGYAHTDRLKELANDDRYGPNGDWENVDTVDCDMP